MHSPEKQRGADLPLRVFLPVSAQGDHQCTNGDQRNAACRNQGNFFTEQDHGKNHSKNHTQFINRGNL